MWEDVARPGAVAIIVDQSRMKMTEPEWCPWPGKRREVSGKEGTVRAGYVYQRHIARCPAKSSEKVTFWPSVTQLPSYSDVWRLVASTQRGGLSVLTVQYPFAKSFNDSSLCRVE